MMRPPSTLWLTPLALVVLLLPACSDTGTVHAPATTTEVATTPTTAPTTTTAPTKTIVDMTAATLLVDEWIEGWNSDDVDAIVSVFADEFYFKGLGPYEPERTDKAAMYSYAESLVPLHIRIWRSSEITPAPDGPLTLTVVIQSDEITPRLTWMELEVQGAGSPCSRRWIGRRATSPYRPYQHICVAHRLHILAPGAYESVRDGFAVRQPDVERERIFPSLSLNHADFSLPSGEAITPSTVAPNSPKSTSSNTTSLERSAATAPSKSPSRNPAAVALLLPASSD
jgi:hypothetical protein